MDKTCEIDNARVLLGAVLEQLRQYDVQHRSEHRDAFNVFEATGIGRKEVQMCAFLAALIAPNGNHEQGSRFLRSFCESVLKLESVTDWDNARVRTEVPIDNDRRIDIAIQAENRYIPIEVKIYAADQSSQCYDYYQYACNFDKDSVLYYLTLDGHEPSPDSKRALEGQQYKCIAFGVEVLDWVCWLLDNKDIQELPNLYTVLTQYKHTLEVMTGRQRRDMVEKMQELICSQESFRAANELEKSLPTIKAKKMRDFFDAVRDELTDYEADFPLAFAGYNNQAEEFYRKRSATWPSLNYLLPTLPKVPDGQQFVLRIEIWDNLYFGVCNWDDSKKINPHGTSDLAKAGYIRVHSGDFGSEKRTDAFYWWKYLQWEGNNIDFRNCNETYEMLYNPELFPHMIKSICGEIRKFFEQWKESGRVGE